MENLPIATQQLDYEDNHFHIFDYQGKVAFLAHEVADILGIKNLTKSIRSSDHMVETEDYLVVPSKTIDVVIRELLRYGKQAPKVTILFEPGFYKFVLRSTKPKANSFYRWVCQNALPSFREMFYQNRKELPHKILMDMIAEERKGSLFARQVLIDHGFKPSPKQLPDSPPGAK